MYKNFLKPFKVIFAFYILFALPIFSDIAQLTDFNFLNFLKAHSPQSCYVILVGTLILYILLVVREFNRNEQKQHSLESDLHRGQSIRTRNVKNSTIIQIRKDKED